MSKFATMTGLINDAEKKPAKEYQRRCRTPEKLRPQPGNRQFLYSLSRSRSVTIASNSSSLSKSKVPKIFVEKKSEIVRNKVKKSSKLRSFISLIFTGNRRRRSSSLSSISLSSSSRSSTLRSAIHRDDSNPNCEDEGKRSGKYLSLSSSSSSSRTSIGAKKDGKKKKKKRHSGSDGGEIKIGRISRVKSVRRTEIKVKEEEKEEKCYELCKKKILMGGRCKPLNSSGKLSYDADGVLVPDPLPP